MMLSRMLPAILVTALAVLVTAPLFAQSPTSTSPIRVQWQAPITAGLHMRVQVLPQIPNPTPQLRLRNLLFTPRDAAQVRVFHPLITPQSTYRIVPIHEWKAQAAHAPK